jgi:hypothetical protein
MNDVDSMILKKFAADRELLLNVIRHIEAHLRGGKSLHPSDKRIFSGHFDEFAVDYLRNVLEKMDDSGLI